jgi:hypothetical protein
LLLFSIKSSLININPYDIISAMFQFQYLCPHFKNRETKILRKFWLALEITRGPITVPRKKLKSSFLFRF